MSNSKNLLQLFAYTLTTFNEYLIPKNTTPKAQTPRACKLHYFVLEWINKSNKWNLT